MKIQERVCLRAARGVCVVIKANGDLSVEHGGDEAEGGNGANGA